jgi:hypothetical protein
MIVILRPHLEHRIPILAPTTATLAEQRFYKRRA